MQNALKSNFQQKEEKSEPQTLRRFRNGIEEEKTYLDYKKNLDKFGKHFTLQLFDQVNPLTNRILQNSLDQMIKVNMKSVSLI